MGKPRRRKLRQRRDDPVLDRVIDDVLNGKVDVIPEFADLPRRWREAPSDATDRKHPGELTKDELLARYIWLAFTQQFAREGLRRLYDDLSIKGEPIPGQTHSKIGRAGDPGSHRRAASSTRQVLPKLVDSNP